MEHAEFYYVTTILSISKIARLMSMRYQVVRDHLFEVFSEEFIKRRQAACYAKSKHGNKNPQAGKQPANYKGLCEDGRGYITVCKPDWYTGRKKYSRIFYHHIVICKALGLTEIPRGFCVHHIDANTRNNDISNLALMTLSAHAKLHKLGRSETKRKL